MPQGVARQAVEFPLRDLGDVARLRVGGEQPRALAVQAGRLVLPVAEQVGEVKKREGERILSKIKDKEYVYVLAIKGKERASEEFAKDLKDLGTYGHSDITFVIGGSLGTSDAVNKRANDLFSFGKLTMPHQLMRLVLIEQIYRAFMINSGSPYHK